MQISSYLDAHSIGICYRFGMDPWSGGGVCYILSRELIHHLNQRDISVIVHFVITLIHPYFSQGWKSAHSLDIPPQWHHTWQDYIDALTESHTRIMEGPNEIIWCIADNGIYSPKASYLAININKQPAITLSLWRMIGKLNAPSRTRLFFWCVLSYKVTSRDQLSHRAFHDPSWCVLCKQASESTDHLFLKCDFSKSL